MRHLLAIIALLTVLIVALISSHSRADSLEVIGGGITEHFIAPHGTDWFKTKIGDSGRLIYNPLYGLKYVSESGTRYTSVTAFMGLNSVGYPMAGASASLGKTLFNGSVYLGGVVGAYKQEVTYGNPTDFLDKVINVGIVPILGVEINGCLHLNSEVFLKLNNLITPILSNTSVSLGINL